MKPPEDKRPPMVVASQIAHEITSVAISMGLFPLGGYWLDQKWNTLPWLTIIGAVVGISIGMFQLVNLGRPRQNRARYPKEGAEPNATRKSDTSTNLDTEKPDTESKGTRDEKTGAP